MKIYNPTLERLVVQILGQVYTIEAEAVLEFVPPQVAKYWQERLHAFLELTPEEADQLYEDNQATVDNSEPVVDAPDAPEAPAEEADETEPTEEAPVEESPVEAPEEVSTPETVTEEEAPEAPAEEVQD